MAKPSIAIIGLGQTGASMGLGLQREEFNFEIVGHDKDPGASQRARKEGAVQRTEWNLFRACDGAELVVVAVPLSELEEILELVGSELRENALVLVLTHLLQPAIDLAERHLPESVHFVAGHPVVTGVGTMPSMRGDLFEEAVFALAAGMTTQPNAIQLASDFVERVGATPLFVDAQEHDGIIAGVEQLPQMLAAALMRLSASGSGWREARRLAGRSFAGATELDATPEALYRGLMANRENVLLRLRQLRQELAEWQELLETETPETGDATDEEAAEAAREGAADEEDELHPLLTALATAVDAREEWETKAITKNWESESANGQTANANNGNFMRQMFLGNFMGSGKRDSRR